MNIKQIFANAIARRVALVLVAGVCAWATSGRAEAANPYPDNGETATSCSGQSTISCAYMRARDTLTKWETSTCKALSSNGETRKPTMTHDAANKHIRVTVECWYVKPPNPESLLSTFDANYSYSTGCTAPQTFDVFSGKCTNKEAECQQKADAPRSTVEIYTGDKCINGCLYGRKPTTAGTSTNNGLTMIWGDVGYTGAVCTTTDPPKPDPPEKDKECAAPSGQTLTVCIKKNGDHCYAATTGRMICWTPGETGTKTDGPVAQKRVPGPNPPTPPTPPDGDTLTDTNKPTTSNITNGTTNITNTTNNFTTGSGSDAGPGNGGESDDGSGGEGEEGEGNGIGGTGDCAGGGYLPSGDPVLGATLTELHKLRCEGDKTKTANTSDTATLGGEGDTLEAQAMGEDRDGFFNDGEGGDGVNEGMFSLGSGQCPEFPAVSIPGTDYTFSAPAQFCSFVQAIAGLFTLAAYVWVFRMLSEG